MAQSDPTEPSSSFFDRERDRLTAKITSSFEDLLSSTNKLNRQVEGVLGMTKEYETIATFWESFRHLMEARGADQEEGKDPARQSHGAGSANGDEEGEQDEESMRGMPGTGGHHVGGGKK
ncbi:hypothetical protein BDV98DRAFT_578412 [Pterulicium gracile]|uniref:DASH complex subunit DAD1 n=1 Tax=Pterulicium gracile TaxID=1884261 RepID=A0A5C3Q3U9_9AGAR|nr:hypothetical protein BDV98DRAFT_578412 [Pterula gracilis]